MLVRLAVEEDMDQLIRMRWDFTLEHHLELKADFPFFEAEYRTFLREAICGERWHIWLAELDAVVSHIYIQLVDKVPRPERITYPFCYMTNVYTLPSYRSRGIGSKILQAIRQWSADCRYEFTIVWPSQDSREFYSRNGYLPSAESMELHNE